MSKASSSQGRSPRLEDLVGGLRTVRRLNASDPVVTSLTQDSREVGPGTVFVAVRGEKADGHRFIGGAVENGAAAIVCEEMPTPLPDCPVIRGEDSRLALSALAHVYFGRPARRLRMTGITGTDGKTSTVEILRTILNEADAQAASIGTLGYCIDGHWQDSDLTTPDPISLHRSFARMVEVGMTDACMEVSSHSLVQHRAAHVGFDAAVLTNITADHLDAHGTRENYARAKRILFEGLGPDAVAVLPREFDFYDSFRKATEHTNVLIYGMEGVLDVYGEIMSLGMDGMEVLVRTPCETYSVHTALTGKYNCENILAAATVAFAYGIGGEVVKEALRGFRGVPGRLERVRAVGRSDLPAVYVDYAHTPNALRKVLSNLRPLTPGKLICVVGCGGDRDRTKRPVMGGIAAERADTVVFTADNSRSERTEDIIDQMVAGIESKTAEWHCQPDRRRAIELAVSLAPTPDSMVVVCGRGCERYQKIAGRNIPFDDRSVAREIMEQMPLRKKRTA